MDRRIAGLLAAAAVAGLVSCAGVKEAEKDVAAATPGLASSDEGVIEAVEGQQITVRSAAHPDQVAQYKRTPSTDLESNDQAIDWSELREGEAVRVSFESEQGPEKLLKLEVLTGGEEAKVKAEVEGAK